jgi:hypothetical protein
LRDRVHNNQIERVLGQPRDFVRATTRTFGWPANCFCSRARRPGAASHSRSSPAASATRSACSAQPLKLWHPDGKVIACRRGRDSLMSLRISQSNQPQTVYPWTMLRGFGT